MEMTTCIACDGKGCEWCDFTGEIMDISKKAVDLTNADPLDWKMKKLSNEENEKN